MDHPRPEANGSRDCEVMREDLGAWIDGELEAAAAGTLESHLARCDACGEFAEELRAQWELLKSLPPSGPAGSPEAFLLAVKARIRRRQVLVRSVTGTAAAALLLVGTIFGFQRATAWWEEQAVIEHLPVLEVIQNEIGDLEPDIFARVLDELLEAEGDGNGAAGGGINGSGGERQYPDLHDLFLVEELEGTRS